MSKMKTYTEMLEEAQTSTLLVIIFSGIAGCFGYQIGSNISSWNRPSIVRDVNEDGLVDVISENKTIFFGTKDGKYLTYEELRSEAFDLQKKEFENSQHQQRTKTQAELEKTLRENYGRCLEEENR